MGVPRTPARRLLPEPRVVDGVLVLRADLAEVARAFGSVSDVQMHQGRVPPPAGQLGVGVGATTAPDPLRTGFRSSDADRV